MKKFLFIAALCALAAVPVWGDWVYEGEFEIDIPTGVAVAPNENIYVVEWVEEGRGGYIFNFTPTGSFLNYWTVSESDPGPIDVAPNANVYVGYGNGVVYYSGNGSYLGKWSDMGGVLGVALAPNGNVYASDWCRHKIQYFTATGSYLGEWGRQGSGDGEFDTPTGVAPALNGYVYVADWKNHRIQYFTLSGSFLGKWGSRGSGDSQFNNPCDVAVRPNGDVYVVDMNNHRVQYFTPTGSFLGKWGKYGQGNAEFYAPESLAFSNDGRRVYVADTGNNRVQYFRWSGNAVTPTSLGRVKSLFR